MKKTIVALFLGILLIPGLIYAETPDPKSPPAVPTAIETALLTKGTILIKNYYPAGKISGKSGGFLTITGITVATPGNEAKKTPGLRVEINSGKDSRTGFAFIDKEEIDVLSKTIRDLIDLAQKMKLQPAEYREVIYVTRDNFKIGFFQSGAQQNAFVDCGRPAEAELFFQSLDDLSRFNTLLFNTYQKIAP